MENKNWLKVDEVCPHCKQVTKKQKGLTKQNIRRLFSFKMDMNEVIMTLIIILVLFSAFSYKNEIQVCRDYVEEAKMSFVSDQDCKDSPSGCSFAFNNITINDIDE